MIFTRWTEARFCLSPAGHFVIWSCFFFFFHASGRFVKFKTAQLSRFCLSLPGHSLLHLPSLPGPFHPSLPLPRAKKAGPLFRPPCQRPIPNDSPKFLFLRLAWAVSGSPRCPAHLAAPGGKAEAWLRACESRDYSFTLSLDPEAKLKSTICYWLRCAPPSETNFWKGRCVGMSGNVFFPILCNIMLPSYRMTFRRRIWRRCRS